MVHSRAFRIAARLALAMGLALATTTPVAASSITATVATSSPVVATVGKPVAFPITVKNTGKNTLNSIVVTGLAASAFTYLSSTPAASTSTDGCSQTQPICTFRQLGSDKSLPPIVFYYRVPTTVAVYPFKVEVKVSEGGKDNSDGTANNVDTFFSNEIFTDVRALDDDFVAGHSVPGTRSFSTGGVDCAGAGLPANCNDAVFPLGTGNPHGTAVTIPVNAEVTASDVAPAADCPAAVTTCFGYGSRLSIASGAPITGGILVTMRWDETDLPNGMTPAKLKVIHLFDPGRTVNGKTYALITDLCTSSTQMNCFVVEPFKLADKDIQATFRLPFNGTTKGWSPK
jgi:uncharacterized repeat protein (TIGR01451 family)